jgi:hypothetical protein
MKVLITAGQVYGKLDDNKLVGNRIRGIWATHFAGHLAGRGHSVTLLIPDTQPTPHFPLAVHGLIDVVRQEGFLSYQLQCIAAAAKHDAAVMAAAVVNWIPQKPIKGKMPTKGHKVGDVIHIPFVLAPRVIEDMKVANPKLTLIGCKMLIGSEEGGLIDAAYGVLLKSRCNAVIANDMAKGLRRKLIVNKDRSVQEFNDDFDGFYKALTDLIEDEHFHTERFELGSPVPGVLAAQDRFNKLVNQHRDRFKPVEGGRVFGSLALTIPSRGYLVSPREKGEAFTAEDAAVVTNVNWDKRAVLVPEGWPKATLNAPLLIRYIESFRLAGALHFHDQVEGLPTLPYAQPGTVRDSDRTFNIAHEDGFNIEGHGCVLPLEK